MFRIASVGVLVLAASASAQVTVYSNGGGSGDNVVGPSPIVPVGSSGWYYNNVRVGSTAGIQTTLPRSGNGSAYFTGTNGSSKGDIEFYNIVGGQLAPMGTLSSLSSMSYDWFRSSTSSVADHLHISYRLLYDADGDMSTTTDRGALVFERIYNGGAAAPTDAWQSDDVFNWNGVGQSANVWMTNTGNPNGSIEEVYGRTIQDWLNSPNPNAAYPSLNNGAVIYGLSLGFGSGWNGTFAGAVDNVTIGFGGNSVTYNFEVVPAPGAAALAGLGGIAALRRRRRR
ncbi:MAG: hypothetical protein QM783_17680 [Phycisphaerales bacterium]